MDVSLLYFDDCPSWKITEERLARLAAEHPTLRVARRRVETAAEAERLGFHGSPSIHVGGVDIFAAPGDAVGLSCRIYRGPGGPAGAPTVAQLRAALRLPPDEDDA